MFTQNFSQETNNSLANGPTALVEMAQGLVHLEPDPWVRLSNISALVFEHLSNLNWCGFYLVKGRQLVLGPFQGRPACVRIDHNKGVCGTAWARAETMLVPNVEHFPGHIACDHRSRSELVVPIFASGKVIGVFDLDSPRLDRFSEAEAHTIEQIAHSLVTDLSPLALAALSQEFG